MKIAGEYVNEKGDVVGVTITLSATGSDIEIEPGGDLEFSAEDTVTIESGVNDSLDVAQQHGCTINLHAKRYVGELFTSEYKDGAVEVTVGGAAVFSGWLEPRVLSMPYNDLYDDLNLQAVDSLSACQYSRYKGVRDTASYNTAVDATQMRTFKDLLKDCLDHGTNDGAYTVWWDSSRSTTDGSDVWEGLQVNDMAFLGDSADDTITYLEVCAAVLKYLDLHIMQYGSGFYVFSWDTVRQGKTQWTRLMGGEGSASMPSWNGVSVLTKYLTADTVEDTNTQLDVQEVYNQLSLTVSPKGDDTVIESPLDGDGTVPALGPRFHYMTEFAVDGTTPTAATSLWNLAAKLTDDDVDTQKVWKDYYVRVMRNVHWKIGHGSGVGSEVTDPVAEAADKGDGSVSQLNLLDGLGQGLMAMLVKVGTADHKPGTGDSSKQATMSMTNYLVIGVNGNGSDTAPYPDDSDLLAAMPLMSYEGGSSTSTYSPASEGETNYLVIDGTIRLCPVMNTEIFLDGLRGYTSAADFVKQYPRDYLGATNDMWFALGKVTPSASSTNDKGRWLTFGWGGGLLQSMAGDGMGWTEADWAAWKGTGRMGHWIPNTGDGAEEYEYKTSDGKDTVDKVDVLWCMLRIGDKVLVEDKTKSGGVDAFTWQTYKSLEDCGNDTDEYLKQTFTIGVDPAIGDKMIGTDFEIGTNFDWEQNISAEKGMAIPLPYSEKLHGKLKFQILGIDNGPWADYHKIRHATMFRHSKWGTDNIPLMAHVGSVVVKDFSVKFYTGNGGDDSGDEDVVYMSKENHKFYNKKDDMEMKIHSGFTSDEMDAYGLSNKIMYTTVCDSDGLPVTSITNTVTGETGKAEKLYVDAYYKELSKPRVILTQNIQCAGMGVKPFALWGHEALGKALYVRDMGWNLMEGSAKAKLEEQF
jgi:hypothetical protein